LLVTNIKMDKLLALINKLSHDELQYLNEHIVERSKQLYESDTAAAMAQFSPGDYVAFTDNKGNYQRAVVLKINKKTVGVIALDDKKWNISPHLLTLEISRNNRSDLLQSAPVNDTIDQSNVLSLTDSGSTDAKHEQEWVGGSFPMPAFTQDDAGNEFQPIFYVWINEFGQVVGMELHNPNDGEFDSVALLKRTLEFPTAGPPGAPSHIRIDNKKLAKKLQGAFPSITVSFASTPELQEVKDALIEDLSEKPQAQPYSEITQNSVTLSSFFSSAAALYKSQPWKKVPYDTCLIGVTVESLGVINGVVSIIGQLNESFGFILFDSLQDYQQYTLATDALTRGMEFDMPTHRALVFDKAADIPANIRKDIAKNQWTIAHTSAYPTLFAPTKERVMRPLTEDDIELVDVIAQGLRLALSQQAFVPALLGEEAYTADYEILTNNRPANIILQAPYPYERVLEAAGAPDDLIAQLILLENTSGEEPDWDAHDKLTNALIEHYEASAEHQAISIKSGYASLIMSFAFNYFDCTIASLTPLALEEIVFSFIPHKVMIKPSDATDVILDTQAFLSFLDRAYGLPSANACLEVLDNNPIERLAHELGNLDNFGIGKSALSSSDFMSPINEEFIPKQSATKPKPASKKSRKKKRSASRKSRKKNR